MREPPRDVQGLQHGRTGWIYCAPAAADDVIAAASRFAIKVRIAGDVRRAPTGANRLTIAAEDTELKYGEGSGAD